MNGSDTTYRKWIRLWLFAGVVMVFFQIMLGGVTRLTGSGLSITKWDIVTGTIPPLGEIQWQGAFELYKATPQYRRINEGMTLSHFKFIFFWEYTHRLWARTMGFVFLIPFLFFVWKRALGQQTLERLGVVIFFALLAALFGWIMVASGLINRPWVNAYKLTIHLLLGISLFVSLFYTWMAEGEIQNFSISQQWYRTIKVLILFTLIQICFGGFVSGMKSALLYPTWPLMNGAWVPEIIFSRSHWNVDNLLLYDQSGFMPALVQVIHRLMAYLLFVFCLVFAFKWKKNQPKEIHWIGYSLVGIIVVQITLGVLTLLGSRGSIPVLYGALHQGVGILLLTAMIYTWIKAKVIET